MSAREYLERDSATWPLWQRRLLFGLRWPMRLIYILSGLIVGLRTALLIPVNPAIVFAAALALLTSATWMALAILVEMLHLSFDVPEIAPAWLRRLLRVCSFPVLWGGAMTASLCALVPLIVIFPSLRDTAIARIGVALICLGVVPMLLLVAGVVFAIPIIIPIAIVSSIRNRRDRRYRELYRNRRLPPW